MQSTSPIEAHALFGASPNFGSRRVLLDEHPSFPGCTADYTDYAVVGMSAVVLLRRIMICCS